MPTGKYPRTKEMNLKMSISTKGRVFSKEHKDRISKSRKGNVVMLPHMGFQKNKDHWNWAGDKVSPGALHCWIAANWVKEKKCELCGSIDKRMYDWSCKDHKYKRNRSDWWVLCRKCHLDYDKKTFGITRGKKIKHGGKE